MQAPYKLYETHWQAPDREWLFHEHLELGKPLKQVAREVGADQGTVQTWASKLRIHEGLDKPYVVGKHTEGLRIYGMTREWLVHEYVERDQSAKQIATELECSHLAIVNLLRRFGISLRDREAMNRRHSVRMSGEGNPAYAGGTSQNYHKRLALKLRGPACEWCRREDDPQVHHRDHNRENGDPDNLRILCGHCNVIEARLWNLEQLGFAAHEYDPEDHVLTIRFGR